jgi:hypothetical protein
MEHILFSCKTCEHKRLAGYTLEGNLKYTNRKIMQRIYWRWDAISAYDEVRRMDRCVGQQVVKLQKQWIYLSVRVWKWSALFVDLCHVHAEVKEHIWTELMYSDAVVIWQFRQGVRCCSLCRWGETMSLNCGHRWASRSSSDGMWVWRAMVELYWKRKYKKLGEKPVQCHFVHDKSHMVWPRHEPGPSQWEASR